MCGIIGVIGKENAGELVIRGMNKISYRGIDGYGFYDGEKCYYSDKISFEKNNCGIAIGHCLHAVVNKVNQPFIGKGVFAVNCEIYNWKDLVKEYSIDAENDAELFFRLLEKFDVEKTLELLDGDYAGVYLVNNKLYLFRDRIGVKPIWYCSESDFCFSSERKVLRDFGVSNVIELNPRVLLVYDLKTKKIQIKNLDFYKTTEKNSSYSGLRNNLGGYLTNAIAKRVPDVKFGLLFSGAIDSGLIALILKKLNVDFRCYTCVFQNDTKEAEDLEYSEKVAEEFGLDLEIVNVGLIEVEKELLNICRLLESNNVTKVGVALPFYFACKKARENDVKVIFSGLGADDLFAGYERHLKSSDINKECYNSLLNIYERDLYRDDIITMFHNIELRVPYLDLDLIYFALDLDGKYKINENTNKFILRDLAVDYGLKKEIAFRKKRAVQYGSNFLTAIEKLAKKNNFKTKSEYLGSLYNEGNVKLAALFSSGKDSCYAMYIMKKQNYDIKCLVTIRSKNKDSFMYHTPNIDMVKLQAEALDLPLIMQNSFGEKEKELKDLEKALVKAKNNYGVEGIVVGALYSTYQRDRVQKVAEKLGLKVFVPLWHKDQVQELRELIENKFEFIISSIAADGLDKNWLGKKITNREVNDLIKLNKKLGINPAGEGGEFESLVLDCPLFNKKLIVEHSEIIMEGDNCGIFNIKKVKLVNKLN